MRSSSGAEHKEAPSQGSNLSRRQTAASAAVRCHLRWLYPLLRLRTSLAFAARFCRAQSRRGAARRASCRPCPGCAQLRAAQEV